MFTSHFEATLDFSRIANLLAHNNISQICYCGQISLQSAANNCSLSDNLTLLKGNIYFAGDGTGVTVTTRGMIIINYDNYGWWGFDANNDNKSLIII